MGNTLLFPAPYPTYTATSDELQEHLVWICETPGTHFPCLWFSCCSSHTLLYFHGNSVDLGEIADEMFILHQHLQCNILAIEFPGYGVCSDMSVDPHKIDEWGDAALDWLFNHGVSPMSVITFGRSIGTGPAAKVAATLKKKGVTIGGVILHCPYLSIHKIVTYYSVVGPWFIENHWDTEQNLKILAPNVPLLIIHGLNDETIPVSHGETLYKTYNADSSLKEGFFPEDSPHNAYLIIDDVARPIEKFLRTKALSRVCLPKKIQISSEDQQIPTNYTEKVQRAKWPFSAFKEQIQKPLDVTEKNCKPMRIKDRQSQTTLSAIKSLKDVTDSTKKKE